MMKKKRPRAKSAPPPSVQRAEKPATKRRQSNRRPWSVSSPSHRQLPPRVRKPPQKSKPGASLKRQPPQPRRGTPLRKMPPMHLPLQRMPRPKPMPTERVPQSRLPSPRMPPPAPMPRTANNRFPSPHPPWPRKRCGAVSFCFFPLFVSSRCLFLPVVCFFPFFVSSRFLFLPAFCFFPLFAPAPLFPFLFSFPFFLFPSFALLLFCSFAPATRFDRKVKQSRWHDKKQSKRVPGAPQWRARYLFWGNGPVHCRNHHPTFGRITFYFCRRGEANRRRY